MIFDTVRDLLKRFCSNHHEPDGAPRMMEETVGCAGQRG
jgi:hypothetical protein